ncbi:hypothetical protein SAMN05216275_106110 [Streptosporangium canum]|uniref:Uncharacterized protein n=1 Tax=Streptosporangium canum TaxID=324952 RepID=A0A1I3N4F2_9ACTN|nr:hypothetical protein SAMN05216275_106110 [Streptosporangium canum]
MGETGAGGVGTGRLWTSSGRFSRTVRRPSRARWNAWAVCAAAVSAEVIRRGTAPTAVARAAWSTKKLDRGSVTSAASTMSGVRLLAASVMPVIALVSPGPWWTLSTPTRPPVRA